MSKIRVTVWNEGIHEKKSEKVRGVYPEGIHGAIAGHLRKQAGIEVVATATIEEPEHGLTEAVLANGRTVLSGKQEIDRVELLETARRTYDLDRLVARRLRCKVEVKP